MDSSYCIKVQIQPLVHRYINIPINFLMLIPKFFDADSNEM
jgi:hypothetical protein